jgi:hypothetical protein
MTAKIGELLREVRLLLDQRVEEDAATEHLRAAEKQLGLALASLTQQDTRQSQRKHSDP